MSIERCIFLNRKVFLKKKKCVTIFKTFGLNRVMRIVLQEKNAKKKKIFEKINNFAEIQEILLFLKIDR